MSGLSPDFAASLQALFSGAPPEIQENLRVLSAYRSPEVQEQLWNDALAKYGSPEAARKWVAPPGRSRHNHGQAVDLRYLDPSAQEWVHANAANYNLHFPMDWEPWHVEPVGARATPLPQGTDQVPAPGQVNMGSATGQAGILGALAGEDGKKTQEEKIEAYQGLLAKLMEDAEKQSGAERRGETNMGRRAPPPDTFTYTRSAFDPTALLAVLGR